MNASFSSVRNVYKEWVITPPALKFTDILAIVYCMCHDLFDT